MVTAHDLKPTKRRTVTDVLREAGIKNVPTGRTALSEWVFDDAGRVFLMLWWEDIKTRDDGVLYIRRNIRAHAERLAGQQIGRAHRQDEAIQRAWEKRRGLRVVLNVGTSETPGVAAYGTARSL